MALQVVILFGFQVLHGYVVAEVSLIVTAFMAGLALATRLAPTSFFVTYEIMDIRSD